MTLVVFAGSVYLRDLRPPPAGAAAPREPGPDEVGWGGVAETEKREEMTREKEIKVVTD